MLLLIVFKKIKKLEDYTQEIDLILEKKYIFKCLVGNFIIFFYQYFRIISEQKK